MKISFLLWMMTTDESINCANNYKVIIWAPNYSISGTPGDRNDQSNNSNRSLTFGGFGTDLIAQTLMQRLLNQFIIVPIQ